MQSLHPAGRDPFTHASTAGPSRLQGCNRFTLVVSMCLLHHAFCTVNLLHNLKHTAAHGYSTVRTGVGVPVDVA